jgi:hypothetical protein
VDDGLNGRPPWLCGWIVTQWWASGLLAECSFYLRGALPPESQSCSNRITDLSDDDLQHLAAADRREVDPPIQVETATWSHAGQLDWWVKERQASLAAYAVQTAVNGGSKLLIFVPPAAHSHDLSLSSLNSGVSRTGLNG